MRAVRVAAISNHRLEMEEHFHLVQSPPRATLCSIANNWEFLTMDVSVCFHSRHEADLSYVCAVVLDAERVQYRAFGVADVNSFSQLANRRTCCLVTM
jgi:hypothetical protein